MYNENGVARAMRVVISEGCQNKMAEMSRRKQAWSRVADITLFNKNGVTSAPHACREKGSP